MDAPHKSRYIYLAFMDEVSSVSIQDRSLNALCFPVNMTYWV